MPRYRYGLIALALLALGAALPSSTLAQAATDVDPAQQAADAARSAACATPVAPGTPLIIDGKGNQRSLPFALDDGAYTVVWSLAKPSEITSRMYLVPADDPSVIRSQTILGSYSDKDVRSGETHVYNVKPGKYYLDVQAPGGWSVTFTPLAV